MSVTYVRFMANLLFCGALAGVVAGVILAAIIGGLAQSVDYFGDLLLEYSKAFGLQGLITAPIGFAVGHVALRNAQTSFGRRYLVGTALTLVIFIATICLIGIAQGVPSRELAPLTDRFMLTIYLAIGAGLFVGARVLNRFQPISIGAS